MITGDRYSRLLALTVWALTVVGCGQPGGQSVADTCQATGEVLQDAVRAMESEPVPEQQLSARIEHVVDAARASRESSLREPAERMAAAWQDSLADDEAAPTMEFGVALNELATECVERGFTYPELGFD